MQRPPILLAALLLVVPTHGLPAHATSDTIVPVILPIENLQDEGYCEWDAPAFDQVSNLWSRASAIGQVLSRPQPAPNIAVARPPGHPETQNINPIAEGEGQIDIRTDVGDAAADLCSPTVAITVIPPPGAPATDLEALATRTRLAATFSLRNFFALSRGAKVRLTITGLPEQKASPAAPLHARTEHPYTEQSPVYLALVKDLASSGPCRYGRRIPLKPPKPDRRQGCR